MKSLAIVLLVAMSAAVIAVRGQQRPGPKPPFTEADVDRGLQYARTSLEIRRQIGIFAAPADPFKIMGNLYFVGVQNGESYLLTSPQGHILMGVGFETSAESVARNIETLGFKLTDVKAILLNHFHGDQSGAVAFFKEKTGAQLMAGFGEIPFVEGPGRPANSAAPVAPATEAPAATQAPLSLFGPYPSAQFQGIHNYRPAKVDRALFDGDVVTVGPLTVTTYLAPGHTPTPASWFFMVRDGNRTYRTLEWCCWELPDDYSRNPLISEATVRHTFQTLRGLLPIDIYLETGSYSWSGMLNQTSGTFQERMARLKTNNALWVNRDVFRSLTAAREMSFEENLAKMRARSRYQ